MFMLLCHKHSISFGPQIILCLQITREERKRDERGERREEDKIREDDHRRRYITLVTQSGPDENSSADSMTIYG